MQASRIYYAPKGGKIDYKKTFGFVVSHKGKGIKSLRRFCALKGLIFKPKIGEDRRWTHLCTGGWKVSTSLPAPKLP